MSPADAARGMQRQRVPYDRDEFSSRCARAFARECHGKRYNRETLEVRYKGKSIADVLEMTVSQAVEFFENVPSILRKIKSASGYRSLGYIKLGQPSSTLSGGENQRVKLATELLLNATRDGPSFILDEPTTGLHFEDIRVLMKVIDKLVDKRKHNGGDREHNLDVIKCADHIIDLGPGGGREGGRIIAEGTPEEVALKEHSDSNIPFVRNSKAK